MKVIFALFVAFALPLAEKGYAQPLDRHEVRRARALNPDFQPTLETAHLTRTAATTERAQMRRAVTTHPRQSSPKSAQLSELSLRPAPGGRAHLRGRIQAAGPVRLYLRFLEGSEVRATRRLGSLDLDPTDGPILFSFLSPMPNFHGAAWSWQVEVR